MAACVVIIILTNFVFCTWFTLFATLRGVLGHDDPSRIPYLDFVDLVRVSPREFAAFYVLQHHKMCMPGGVPVRLKRVLH